MLQVESAFANSIATNGVDESFACPVAIPDIVLPEITIGSHDVDFSDTNDFGAIADDDGKIEEFMNYIEKVDREREDSENKLNFKEYLDEPPHRLRYPSYNLDGKDLEDDENLNMNVLSDESDEPNDDGSDNPTVKDVSQAFLNAERVLEDITRRRSSLLGDLSRKSSINEDSTEFYNHSPLQRIQKVDNSPCVSRKSSIDTKMLSPTDSQIFIDEIDFVFVENDSQEATAQVETAFKEIDTNRIQIDEISSMKPPQSRSASFAGFIDFGGSTEVVEDVVRHESLLDVAPKLLGHEHNWSSISDASRRSERSPSHCSELEYIPGRDDWRAMNQQIDSDDYHHHRRYSETTDILEYIKGRDDWLVMEAKRDRKNTLPNIHETQSRLDIRDEIDSDEYHHYRRLEDIVAYAARDSKCIFVAQGSARSGRERSPYRVLRTDINKDELIERYIWKDGGEVADIPFGRTVSEPIGSSDDSTRIHTEKYIWVAAEGDRSRSASPPFSVTSITIDDQAIGGDETHILIPSSNVGTSNENMLDISVVTEDDYGQSTVEIHDIIEHSNEDDPIFTTTDDSIEVVVVNLKDDGTGDDTKDPIILISGIEPLDIHTRRSRSPSRDIYRTDDSKQQSTDDEDIGETIQDEAHTANIALEEKVDELIVKAPSKEPLKTEFIDTIESLTDLLETIESASKSSSDTDNENKSIATKHLNEKETNSTDKRTDNKNVITNDNTNIRKTTTNISTKPNNKINHGIRRRQSNHSDNFDDLIGGGLGPWFHK